MRLAVCLHLEKAEYGGAEARAGMKDANDGFVYSPSEISCAEESAMRSTEGS